MPSDALVTLGARTSAGIDPQTVFETKTFCENKFSTIPADAHGIDWMTTKDDDDKGGS